jgi:hypothetical protein
MTSSIQKRDCNRGHARTWLALAVALAAGATLMGCSDDPHADQPIAPLPNAASYEASPPIQAPHARAVAPEAVAKAAPDAGRDVAVDPPPTEHDLLLRSFAPHGG